MKKLLILSLLALMTFSCGEDFLEIAPESEANQENFFKNSDDFVAAVNSIYAELQSGSQYGNQFMGIMETRGDNVENNNPGGGGGTAYQLDQFTDTPSNSILKDVWSSLYRGVYKANVVLAKIESPVLEETLRKQLKGEARFLRALSYFNLVRLWGRIPLVLSPVLPEDARSTLTRNSIDDIYAAIEDDLVFAEENLPPSFTGTDLGRATSGSASALLGKVYLTLKRYDDVIRQLAKVEGKFELLPNVADVSRHDNEMNKEIIFAIRYTEATTGLNHGAWFGYTGAPTILSKFLQEYLPEDKRLPLVQGFEYKSKTFVPGKFKDGNGDDRFGNDFPVLRYADVLLMIAEALNEKGYDGSGKAMTLLNSIRQRAGIPAYSASDLPDQASFRNAVLKERRLELALENDRWFDLVRTGTASAAISAAQPTIREVPDFRLIYPIPQSEIDAFGDPVRFPQNDLY